MSVFLLPKFPALVVAGDGINIVKSGRTYTFSSSRPVPPEIIDLPAVTLPLGGTEPLAIYQGGAAKSVTQAQLIGAQPITNKGTVTSGIVTFNVATGYVQKLTVGGNLSIAFSGWPAAGNKGEIEIELVNGGAFTVIWPTVKWLLGDGTNSTTFADMGVALQAADTNWIVVWSTDGGTTLWGRAV